MSYQYKIDEDKKIDLSIIIVNYNTKRLLRQCLKSINIFESNINFEVLVVDNASYDGSCQMVKNEFSQVKLIENKKNLGFSRANNEAVKSSRGEYILFLNTDTVILENAIEEMLKFMKTYSEAGALGPKLLNPDGTLQFSCRKFYTLRAILARRTFLGKIFPSSKSLREHLMSDWDHNDVREVDWVMGACLLVRRNVLDIIGLLDEKYIMYFEDVDLCYRIKQSGFKVYYVPRARVIHYYRRESAQKFSIKTIWHIQSMLRFYKKHWRTILKEKLFKLFVL